MKEEKLKQTRKSLTAIEMFKHYNKKHPKEINYLLYKEVISRYNKKMSEHVLNGETLKLGFHLGNIRIRKVKRSFKNPVIDWAESRKLQKQGIEKYLVYYTDEYWYRWYWEKKKCTVKNKTVYCFIPTVSNSRKDGNKNKLVEKLRSNPLIALKYQL